MWTVALRLTHFKINRLLYVLEIKCLKSHSNLFSDVPLSWISTKWLLVNRTQEFSQDWNYDYQANSETFYLDFFSQDTVLPQGLAKMVIAFIRPAHRSHAKLGGIVHRQEKPVTCHCIYWVLTSQAGIRELVQIVTPTAKMLLWIPPQQPQTNKASGVYTRCTPCYKSLYIRALWVIKRHKVRRMSWEMIKLQIIFLWVI